MSAGTSYRKSRFAIAAIIVLIFFLALAVRLQPAEHGHLDEFDPFWNYKATSHLVENGWQEYKSWNDQLSWFPDGRNVSKTSQEALHLSTAFLYNFYDGELYQFAIIIPAVYGALGVFPIYVIGRYSTGSAKVGIISSFLYSIAISILLRNSAGWFKSESLGLTLSLGFVAVFLLCYRLGGIRSLAVAFAGGLLMSFAVASWVGSVIFAIPLVLFSLLVPVFMQNRNLGKSLLVFAVGAVIPLLVFERAVMFAPFIAVFLLLGVWNVFGGRLSRNARIAVVCCFVLLGVTAVYHADISDRYKSILFPFIESDAVVRSVSEHQIPQLQQIFIQQGFLIFFAPLGFMILIKMKSHNRLWLLVFVVVLLYFGFSFARLQLVMTVALIFLTAVGIVDIYNYAKKQKNLQGLKKYGFVVVLAVTIAPFAFMWVELNDRTPMILVGASPYLHTSNDWLEAMQFLRSTDPDSAIFAWWDYGYYISVLGQRASFMDNSTLFSNKIKQYAELFVSSPESAHSELKKLGADYVMVYSITIKSNQQITVGHGGDESKLYWVSEIAGDHIELEDTMIGRLLPVVVSDSGSVQLGVIDSELFELVFVSESLRNDLDGIRYGVLIYKIV